MPDKRIRGRRLQAIRRRVLTDNPLCVACQAKGRIKAADEVDHIVALANDGSDNYDNRQGLCIECHKEKTAIDLGYKRHTEFDASGNPKDESHPWNQR